MQEIELIGGFSDLKRLLILTFKIERDPALVKLHFTIEDNTLYLHDYDQHENRIAIVGNVQTKKMRSDLLTTRAEKVVRESLLKPTPEQELNKGFLLHGTFRL